MTEQTPSAHEAHKMWQKAQVNQISDLKKLGCNNNCMTKLQSCDAWVERSVFEIRAGTYALSGTQLLIGQQTDSGRRTAMLTITVFNTEKFILKNGKIACLSAKQQ